MHTDKNQLEAIRHGKEPAMVIAGPGSGKTHVIIRRVLRLIETRRAPAEKILVVTFTRAAAMEMKKRFEGLTGRDDLPVSFATFHSLFFLILRNTYNLTKENIASDARKLQFISAYTRRLGTEDEEPAFLARRLMLSISKYKNIFGTDRLTGDFFAGEELFKKVFEAYGEFLSQEKLLDFDDMAIRCRRLFETDPKSLHKWRTHFSHILVDEFQDINKIQYETLKLMAPRGEGLFVVGDDDQSIYGFRGSDPRIMQSFERDFPGAKRFSLFINYRSAREIVGCAVNLIESNKNRFKKAIEAANSGGEEPAETLVVRDAQAQYEYISEIVRKQREGGVPFSEMAVLVRTNRELAFAADELEGRGIVCSAGTGKDAVYGSNIAGDITAYISASLGDRRRITFLRIMNRPRRGILRASLPPEPVSIQAWADFYAGDKKMCERLFGLWNEINFISKLSPAAAVSYIRTFYDEYAAGGAGTRQQQEKSMSVLETIERDAQSFGTLAEFLGFLKAKASQTDRGMYIKNENGGRYALERKDGGAEGVRILTMHSAKGLEFDTVFIADAAEGYIPDYSAVSEGELEEERRLFYVAMTRAKNRLVIIFPEKIRGHTQKPSRFIAETGMALRTPVK